MEKKCHSFKKVSKIYLFLPPYKLLHNQSTVTLCKSVMAQTKQLVTLIKCNYHTTKELQDFGASKSNDRPPICTRIFFYFYVPRNPFIEMDKTEQTKFHKYHSFESLHVAIKYNHFHPIEIPKNYES